MDGSKEHPPRRPAEMALVAVLSIASVQLATPDAAAADFVRRSGAGLATGGAPFPVLGVNCYYLMVYAAEPGLRAGVDEVLEKAAALGATTVRTWAFNDGADQWNALQTSPGVYSEHVFRGLDHVVKKAGDLGLRLILPLVNQWDDYGGMRRYVAWSSTSASHDDFYTDAQVKAWYRAHMEKIVSRVNTLTGVRYRDDPAILAWELANEPRAEEKGPAVLAAWIDEMAAHVKSLDPNHLATTGSEGFFGSKEASWNPRSWMSGLGVDFIAQHASPHVDFAAFHVWPDNWGIAADDGVRFAARHFDNAARALGKPVIAEEFGLERTDGSGGTAARDAFFEAVYDLAAAASAPGSARAGALLWILYHDDYPDYDGFGVYAPRDATTVAVVKAGHQAIRDRAAAWPAFVPGDVTCDGVLDTSDAVRSLEHLFKGRALACCEDAVDSNGDGETDVSDVVYSLVFTFLGGPPPRAPFPGCGASPGCPEPMGYCAN